MNISVEPALIEQKDVLKQMMELFLYDFSEFSGDDIGKDGRYGYEWIDAYWEDEGRFPFFIRVDGKLAGLVLVRSCSEYNELDHPHNIAEFFVMKKYRRKGVGKDAAKKVFAGFDGDWEVAVWSNNHPAQSFWENAIAEYTGGNYRTFEDREKNVNGFTFRSTGK